MSIQEPATHIDPILFRQVLGQYPTGVSIVTAMHGEEPAGMVVGSFTSVSLDPPLVAFLVDRKSSTWPKIELAGTFCVNVLSADQEQLCRTFATSGADRFAGVSWRKSEAGSPLIDNSVARIDCAISSVHTEGDHFIVIGAVLDLAIERNSLPLLFFRGGYGSFRPHSLAAAESGLLGQLREIDAVRPAMEQLSAELGLECDAAIAVRDELVIMARSGADHANGQPARVGAHLPLKPPVGGPLVAWEDQLTIAEWTARIGRELSEAEAQAVRAILDRIRTRGYAYGLGHSAHEELWKVIARDDDNDTSTMDTVVDNLLPGYGQDAFEASATYDVRTIAAPVFNRAGHVTMQFTIFLPPDAITGDHLTTHAAALTRATRVATEALGGVWPTH